MRCAAWPSTITTEVAKHQNMPRRPWAMDHDHDGDDGDDGDDGGDAAEAVEVVEVEEVEDSSCHEK